MTERAHLRARITACITRGIDGIQDIADVTGSSYNTVKAAMTTLVNNGDVIAYRVRNGWRYRMANANPDEGPVRLATSPALRDTHLTRDDSLHATMEQRAYACVHARGAARAPLVAQEVGLSYHDALGALWRLVAFGHLRAREPDGEHAVFMLNDAGTQEVKS